ncbi:MAG TPA: DUF2089 domain-containing protein [Dehalococcoidia bacterium]|nr:DUF2089 domain-containing protein [Dehalococcoidia bacterium]
MHPVPTQCPVCGQEPRVTRLHCDNCGTAVEGVFSLGAWQRLNRDQLAFAEVFIKRRGKIKDVEDELGVSYPTVVARLNELLAAMGFDSSGAPPPEEPETNGRGPQRQQILDELAAGSISATEAAQRLREL